jgi:hypothetical protein
MDASRSMRAVKGSLGHFFKSDIEKWNLILEPAELRKSRPATSREMFFGTGLSLSLGFDPVDPVSSPLSYLLVWVCCPRLQ